MTSIIKVDTIQDQDGNNIINENANTITIGASGDTITIPSGATLVNSGTATGFASIAWQSVQTTGFTAVAGRGYPCNTTSAAFTVTLPASASVGDQIQIVDYAGTFATYNITLGANGLNIEGGTVDKILTTAREGVTVTYVDATQGWVATSGVNSGTQAIDPIPYSVDFLVVAGGGSGATSNSASHSEGGGGGGGGGYRTSTQTGILPGVVITVTVGDGGASFTTANTVGNDGSNSSISGSGLTTITSTGGGGGGNTGTAGRTGGSGGGGGAAPSGGAGGAGNTPSTSPSQGNNGGSGADAARAGGGGGAGAVGQNGSASPAKSGDGGAGTASSITGSSVTRTGGGGGGHFNTATIGSGGTGGGGAGGANANPGGNAVSGTVNTGSGGGGNSFNASYSVGAGGKGVVILSMPDASYSGTTTGSPTVATGVSGQTVLTFNGTGSYTT